MGYVILILVLVVIAVIISRSSSKKNEPKVEEPKKIEKQNAKQDTQKVVADANRLTALAELMRQSKENGDEETYNLIMANKYDGPLPEKTGDGWTNMYELEISIAGINYRENMDKYIGTWEVTLVPDPENEYDPNAIKIVNADGVLFGFVPKDMTDTVRKRTSLPAVGTAVIAKGEEDDIDSDGEYFYGKVRIKDR